MRASDATPLAPGDAARLSAADCMFAVAAFRASICVRHSLRLPRRVRLDWISCVAAFISRDVRRLPLTGVRVSKVARRPSTSRQKASAGAGDDVALAGGLLGRAPSGELPPDVQAAAKTIAADTIVPLSSHRNVTTSMSRSVTRRGYGRLPLSGPTDTSVRAASCDHVIATPAGKNRADATTSDAKRGIRRGGLGSRLLTVTRPLVTDGLCRCARSDLANDASVQRVGKVPVLVTTTYWGVNVIPMVPLASPMSPLYPWPVNWTSAPLMPSALPVVLLVIV
jgi:hypothetical protein